MFSIYNMIHHGDCLEVMNTFEANSIDSIITDPPYGLSFMGKNWDHGIPGVPYWAEMLRVAKPGAMLLAFGGTRTFHRLTCAIEDAGWEIRDCLMWLYGSGFPKSMDISKAIDRAAGAEREVVGPGKRHSSRAFGSGVGDADYGKFAGGVPPETAPSTTAAKRWDGWGTALKPAWEPIILAMKPLDGTFAANAQEHGVAGLNIDGARVSANKDKGRWPANVILDEEAGTILDAQTGILTSGKCPDGYSGPYKAQVYGKYARNEINPETVYGDSGGASRFFYCAKASKKEKGKDNNHPTVKPLALMEYLCTLTKTPTGGVVLDPFAGSGTTLIAARNTGRQFIGIEQEADYIKIINKRLAA